MLARDTGDRQSRALPDIVMVDLGDRGADAVLQLRLRRAEVLPFLLQRVRLREVKVDREDADEAACHSRRLRATEVAQAPPSLDTDLVRTFVANAHGDIDAARAALGDEPALANAAWDWGGGDWETALGAAGHMGRRDIAELLIDHGARIDLFVAAMLGEIEIVRAILTAHPGMREAKGPHGIPLLAHAEAGGERAAAVVALLA
jgi:hypothetical protein